MSEADGRMCGLAGEDRDSVHCWKISCLQLSGEFLYGPLRIREKKMRVMEAREFC